MAAPRDIAVEELPAEALRRLVGELLGEVARLREENAALREEIARLKGLSGRPKIKPSGMERATAAEGARPQGGTKGAAKATGLVVHEEHVLAMAAPPGSRFKGYEDVVVAMRTSSSGRYGWSRG
jgi:hypothetical protein